MSAQQPWTGIQIETSFFPLSFFLYFCTPTIIIDGQPTRRAWGTHNFPTAGGLHNVQIMSDDAAKKSYDRLSMADHPREHRDWPALLRLLDRKNITYKD